MFGFLSFDSYRAGKCTKTLQVEIYLSIKVMCTYPKYLENEKNNKKT